jgi:hypothetical protein
MESNKLITYARKDGGVCIITPVLDCGLTEAEIAAKDVPTGSPFKIITADNVPIDRYFREAWEVDFSQPDGHGADHGVQAGEGA